MTGEEAIKYLKEMKDECNDTIHKVRYVTQEEALEMAIKALEQEPSGDAISRQAVQDYIAKYLSQYLYDDVREAVEVIDEYIGELPSVKQEPKTGHWIPTYGNVKCSVCGSVKESRRVGKATHYCDFCGARMVEQERSGNE